MLNKVNLISYVKRVLFWATGIIAGICVILIGITMVFEDDIINYFTQRINEQLATEVSIEKIDLSLFSGFPNASIRCKNVIIKHPNSFQAQKDHLLRAESLHFRFSIIDLLRGSYDIRSIQVENAQAHIMHDLSGNWNTNIFKPRIETNAPIEFNLRMLKLKDVNLLFEDAPNLLQLQCFVQSTALKGQFKNDVFSMTAEAELIKTNFHVSQTNWLNNQNIILSFEADVDKLNEVFSIYQSDIQVADLNAEAKGFIRYAKETEVDLTFNGKELEIRSILSLVPEGFIQNIQNLRSDGLFWADAQLKGSWTKETLPFLDMNFGMKNTEISRKGLDVKLQNVSLNARLEAGGNRKGKLVCNNINVMLNKHPLSGSFQIDHFKNPNIIAKLNGNIDLKALHAMLEFDEVKDVKGEMLVNLSVNGPLSDFAKNDYTAYSKHVAAGKVKLDNASFRYKGDTVLWHNINGLFVFDKQSIQIEELKLFVGTSDLKLSGSLTNFFPWAFSKNEVLEIHGNLWSNYMALEDILRENGSNQTDEFKANFSSYLTFELDAHVNKLSFKKFNATQIDGKFNMRNSTVFTNQLNVKTMDGSVALTGKMKQLPSDAFDYVVNANLYNVNISKLFHHCNKFGQDILVDKHIGGTLNASVLFKAQSNAGLTINQKSVSAEADIHIKNGELIQFKPLEALSKFVALDELNHVRFSDLKNRVEIRNERVFIPKMDIHSNALNISGYGQHSFENVVDYHIRLRLSELLAKKAKSKQKSRGEDFGEIAEDDSGKLNIFLHMTGTASNPQFTYDGKGAKEKIKTDIVMERQSLKQTIKDEFKVKTKSKDKERDDTNQRVLIEFEE